jgi:hypothetical protein
MPVNNTHPDYDSALAAWMRARDVFAGEDAVKTAGKRYLPKLDSQSADEFDAYKSRASFFNATARTADGFVGLIFRREPTLKLPEDSNGAGRALAAFVADADMLGTSLSSYAKNVVTEVVAVGRAGTGGTERNANFSGAVFLPDPSMLFSTIFMSQEVAGCTSMHVHAPPRNRSLNRLRRPPKQPLMMRVPGALFPQRKESLDYELSFNRHLSVVH